MDKIGALLPWRAEHRDRPADEDALTLRDELVVTAEVPGLDREDLELMITPGALIIWGEKREAPRHASGTAC